VTLAFPDPLVPLGLRVNLVIHLLHKPVLVSLAHLVLWVSQDSLVSRESPAAQGTLDHPADLDALELRERLVFLDCLGAPSLVQLV